MAEISSDVIRGYNDTMILCILYDKPSYGYEISKEIRRITDSKYIIKETTLYSNYDLKGTRQEAGTSGSASDSWGAGFACSVGFYVFALALMTGIMVWSVYLSSTIWLFVLLCFLCAVVEWSAGCMADMFLDEGEPMSKEKRSLLRWGCVFLLCIPLAA